MSKKRLRKPEWLKISLPHAKTYATIREIAKQNKLHTICESGNCPNKKECWEAGTATFMILGDICTRSCRFCAVKTGKPLPIDENEPKVLAETIKKMNLKHCVITSVDRDDLPDGGAAAWSNTIIEIRKQSPNITLETLIPDFQFNKESLDVIIKVKPEIVSHNIETVRSMTKQVRVNSIYERSLSTLNYLQENGIRTKSGIMVGVGETDKEIYETMDDLLNVNCKILTIGQYLQPTVHHLDVQRYVTPEQFNEYAKIGLEKGFEIIESAPLVRSSYHAEKHLK